MENDHIIRHMLFACWIPNSRSPHSEYVYLMFFTATMFERKRLNVTLYVTAVFFAVTAGGTYTGLQWFKQHVNDFIVCVYIYA